MTNSNDLEALAQKYSKAKAIAVKAAKDRVSRRLLLAKRAEQLTITCDKTGIVSLLDIPAIPGFALSYEHPLARLPNARGIAQQGTGYLQQLDTQVLAGISIVLAEPYELFSFPPASSGAAKNAILRAAGKEALIDLVSVVENYINSKSITYAPKLSFLPGVANTGAEDRIDLRIHSYLSILLDSLRKPDLVPYDPDVPPVKTIRPVYTKEVESRAKKQRIQAKKALASSKKSLAEDRKSGKALANTLFTDGKISMKMKGFLHSLFAEDALLTVSSELVEMLISQKLAPLLEETNDARFKKLIEILKAPRKGLDLLDLGPDSDEDDSEEDEEDFSEEDEDEELEQSDCDSPNPVDSIDSNKEDPCEAREAMAASEASEEPEPPVGLSPIAKILWLKKWRSAQANLKT